jgi:hypothetical protein
MNGILFFPLLRTCAYITQCARRSRTARAAGPAADPGTASPSGPGGRGLVAPALAPQLAWGALVGAPHQMPNVCIERLRACIHSPTLGCSARPFRLVVRLLLARLRVLLVHGGLRPLERCRAPAARARSRPVVRLRRRRRRRWRSRAPHAGRHLLTGPAPRVLARR